jgi:catechol 2,3-dioxygenase-like lactoylglutathione lyase family enzyme
MKQEIALVALLVNDYDEAIDFYTKKLQFTLVEDSMLSPEKRWVVLAPPGSSSGKLLLAKAASSEQKKAVGNQSGGRVFLFLHTDDFWRDYKKMRETGIEFVREPVKEKWGTVSVFKDLYGNLWDMIQPENQ